MNWMQVRLLPSKKFLPHCEKSFIFHSDVSFYCCLLKIESKNFACLMKKSLFKGHRAELCLIFCLFFGRWRFREIAFEIYWPLDFRNQQMSISIKTITRYFIQSIHLNLEEPEIKRFYRYFVYQLKNM